MSKHQWTSYNAKCRDCSWSLELTATDVRVQGKRQSARVSINRHAREKQHEVVLDVRYQISRRSSADQYSFL